MSDQDDARLLREVRAAEVALAEHPSPRVRQAVMRAALAAAASAAPAVPGVPGDGIRRSAPWSYALAASVLAGAVAFVVFQQVQAPKPPTVVASVTPPDAKIEAAEPEPKPKTVRQVAAPAAVAPPVAELQASSAKKAAATSEIRARTRQDAPGSAGDDLGRDENVAAMAKRRIAEPSNLERFKVEQAENVPREALASVQRERSADTLERSVGGPVAAGRLGGVAAAGQAAPSAGPSDLAAKSASVSASDSSAAPALAAPPMAAVLPVPTAKEWVDRIVAMRRAGRQDEADRELAALRKQYPNFVVPATALRPPG